MSRTKDPAARITRAETNHKAGIPKNAAATERATTLRAEIAHLEANPLSVPASEYHETLARLRRALPGAEDEARREFAELQAAEQEQTDARQAFDGVEEPRLSSDVDEALAAGTTKFLSAAALAAETVAIINEKIEARDVVRARLRSAGAVVTKDDPWGLGTYWASLVDSRPGAVGAFATALNVAIWLDRAPQREGERAEMERRRKLDREATEQTAALRGDRGLEALEAATKAARSDLRVFGGKRVPDSVSGAKGTVAELALQLAASKLTETK